MTDLRLVQARGILAGEGLAGDVSVAGHAEDVLAVRAPIAQLGRLRALAPELKQLGFRYIALELAVEEERA